MTGFAQSIITILLFIFILGALVVIHELGHFVTARLMRVKVLEFGVGFPPRAKVLRNKGETIYTLNWLPIGGFVKLEGEDGDAADDPRSFSAQSLPRRLVILVAGVAMNVLLAFVIFTGIALFADPAVGVVIAGVEPGSPAAAAGLVAGDTIVSLNGEPHAAFDSAKPTDALRAQAGETVTIGIKSADGSTREVQATLRPASEIDKTHGALGIQTASAVVLPDPIHYDLVQAMQIGAQRTVDALGLIVGGLASLVEAVVNRPTEAPPVSGPVGIATQLGDVFWQLGPIFTLYVAGRPVGEPGRRQHPAVPAPRRRADADDHAEALLRRADERARRADDLHGRLRLPVRVPHLGDRLRHRPQPGWRRHVTSPDRLRPRRRATVSVDVGGVLVGSAHPVVVQSMTNTDTADPDGTAIQVARLAHAGSQLVRVTVNTDEAAAAVPEMVRKVRGLGVDVPIVGDFHYNGHKLLVDHPEMAAALAKYRINPGNVGAKRHDEHFATIVKVAVDNDKPVRIGVNWGSLDQAILTELMDINAALAEPRDARDVMIDAMLESALRSAELAEQTGMRHDRIILSAKVSGVRDLVDVYRLLATRCDYPLHLGLTEAGMGDKGIIASTAGLAILLNEGIGDTIRVSLTPEPGAPREREVEVAQQVLQSMGLRSFLPQVSACPGCGRTTSTFFQEMAQQIQGYVKEQMPIWRETHPGRRGPAGRRDGLRRQRSGRVQARRHRDQPPGHVRGAGGAGLHRRAARPDAARRRARGGVHRDPGRVRGEAVSDTGLGRRRAPRMRRHSADVVTPPQPSRS